MNSIVFLSPLCIQETEGEYFPFQVFIKKRAKRNDIVVSSVAGGKKASVVFFLLGDTPASEFYVPTFRNMLSVPSSKYGTVFRNVGT